MNVVRDESVHVGELVDDLESIMVALRTLGGALARIDWACVDAHAPEVAALYVAIGRLGWLVKDFDAAMPNQAEGLLRLVEMRLLDDPG